MAPDFGAISYARVPIVSPFAQHLRHVKQIASAPIKSLALWHITYQYAPPATLASFK